MNRKSQLGAHEGVSRTTRKVVALSFASALVLGLAGCQTAREAQGDVQEPVRQVVQPVPERFAGMTADRIEAAIEAEKAARGVQGMSEQRIKDYMEAQKDAASQPAGWEDMSSEQIRAYYEARKAAAAEEARKALQQARLEHNLGK